MLSRVINYFTSSFEELKKVVWPSRQEVISHTIIVVLAIAISMAIIVLLDLGLFDIVERLIH